MRSYSFDLNIKKNTSKEFSTQELLKIEELKYQLIILLFIIINQILAKIIFYDNFYIIFINLVNLIVGLYTYTRVNKDNLISTDDDNLYKLNFTFLESNKQIYLQKISFILIIIFLSLLEIIYLLLYSREDFNSKNSHLNYLSWINLVSLLVKSFMSFGIYHNSSGIGN